MHPFATEVRERGWRPALLDGWTHAHQRVTVDEVHTWFEMGLAGGQRHAPSTDGPGDPASESALKLLPGTAEYLQLIDRLPTVNAAVAARRLATGARWWLLVEGEEPVFSCWTFSRVIRMIGAPAGALVLPPDVVFLEDSVTSPRWRGAGVGQLALTEVCRLLGQEGPRWILTKVKVGNTAPERLVAKVGFLPLATVRIRCRGPIRRTWAVMAAGAANAWLPGALGAVNGNAPDRRTPLREWSEGWSRLPESS